MCPRASATRFSPGLPEASGLSDPDRRSCVAGETGTPLAARSGATVNDATQNAFERATKLLDMSGDEVREGVRSPAVFRSVASPGIAQLDMLAPINVLRTAASMEQVRDQYNSHNGAHETFYVDTQDFKVTTHQTHWLGLGYDSEAVEASRRRRAMVSSSPSVGKTANRYKRSTAAANSRR